LVQPVGIEPTSTALQTAAMTTSARVAYLGCLTGIDPVLPLSQSRVQATTLKTPSTGTANRNRTHIHSLEESCILHYTIAVLWPVRRDSNSRRLVSKTSTLPLSYGPNCLAELLGLEPRMTQSKCVVLPLHYSSTDWWRPRVPPPVDSLLAKQTRSLLLPPMFGGNGWTRTNDEHRMKVPHLPLCYITVFLRLTSVRCVVESNHLPPLSRGCTAVIPTHLLT
jgi:hypothetical protein